MDEDEELTASVTVTNTGERAGQTVIQLYIAPEKVEMIRPVRELKGFEKVELAPGESKTVTFTLGKRTFAHWNPIVHSWRCENGKYTIQIGESAHDIVLETAVEMTAEPIPPVGGYGMGMPMGEFAKSPRGHKFLDENIEYMIRGMVIIASFIGTGMNKGGNSPKVDAIVTPIINALDIAGYNYGSGRYPLEGKQHPERIIFGSETFPQDIYKNWEMVKKYPYLLGDFMWTAWDYLGEAGMDQVWN